MAYVLLVEANERQTLADRQIVALAKLIGQSTDDLPTVTEAEARLDEALTTELETATPVVDMEQWALRRALGVA